MLEMEESRVIGPLIFSKERNISVRDQLYPSSVQIPCLFCNKNFTFYAEKHEYLAHLYLEHRLIIGDEDHIAIFHEYLILWHQILKSESKPIDIYCFTMVMNQLPDGSPSKDEKYYLLCDVSQKDSEIRQQLQKKRMDLVLTQHQFERTDKSFKRDCLFCRDVIETTRYAYIEHMFDKHYLKLGKAETLVFIDVLIDSIESRIRELVCIFCEKKFKDRSTLKEHMRKKQHKRINPENKYYDQFFLVNFRNETQKNGLLGQKQSQEEPEDDNDCNWSDWEEEDIDITCLFCELKSKSFVILKEHIKSQHGINFEQAITKLSFYDRVKMVNFVRRAMYKLRCIKCGGEWNNKQDFQNHLKINNHYSLGESSDWNFPEYFFSTYEDDAFLHHLEDVDEEDVQHDPSIAVFSEDTLETKIDSLQLN